MKKRIQTAERTMQAAQETVGVNNIPVSPSVDARNSVYATVRVGNGVQEMQNREREKRERRKREIERATTFPPITMPNYQEELFPSNPFLNAHAHHDSWLD